MGLFGTKKEDRPSSMPDTGVIQNESPRPPMSQVRGAAAPSAAPGRLGIDHAIDLIRSLPTEQNVDLVVKVLKTTLESLGIRVADIVLDAAQRQKELQGRTGQLKSEIAALEKEIEQRTQEIGRLEAAYAETTKVRGYLEEDQVELTPDEDDARS
jgi:hypothetical protein